MTQIVLIFLPWKSGHCSVRIFLEKIGVWLERTRGNLLRKRESWSKRGPVFVARVASRRVAWRGVAWRGRRGHGREEWFDLSFQKLLFAINFVGAQNRPQQSSLASFSAKLAKLADPPNKPNSPNSQISKTRQTRESAKVAKLAGRSRF